jgi:hypothetical protein
VVCMVIAFLVPAECAAGRGSRPGARTRAPLARDGVSHTVSMNSTASYPDDASARITAVRTARSRTR